MDFDQTQAIYDYEEDEEEQVEDEKANPKKKEVAHLKVFSQQGFKETIFPVFQGDNVLGRDGKCNITVPIKALSKKHACIEVQRDLHLIYDCGSKNRTKKGKSFLKPTVRYELKHGDMLTLGDVKCQYLVGLDMEEEDDEETGSETGSESMLQDVNTEEELDVDKPNLTEDASISKKIDERGSIPREELLQEDHQMAKPTKDDEEAYAADTDSDTDEERPIAVAAMPTVLYSSEDEQETPQRQQAPSVTNKGNSSMEGQTLAFGLGSPGNVFQSRDSTGSSGSHPGQTASIPPTLMLSTESDSQSDGKRDVPSDQDNKPSPFKHPGTRGSGTQPPCEPTLVYGSESDDGSPIKRPKHPEARVSDKGLSCEPEPTLLYGSESDDGTPKKKPRQPGASNEPTLLYESDSEEGTGGVPKESDARGDGHRATDDQTLLYSEVSEGKPPSIPAISSGDVGDGSPGESAEERPDNNQEATVAVKDSDATLPYAEVEMSSTDDEDDSETDANDKKINNLDETPADAEPTLAYADDLRKQDATDDEQDNVDAEDYGADIATQAYAVDDVDSDSEADSEPIPLGSGNAAPESDANQPAKPFDLEATQAYCAEEEDSDSSDSQPLLIGAAVSSARDDISATMAYGLEATQAYDICEKDGDSDENEDKDEQVEKPTLVYDLQATQAYGAGDDDDDNEDTRESDQGPSANDGVSANRSEADHPTIAYGLEATQAYGADDETDDEAENEDRSSTGWDQGRGHDANAATLAYGLDPTQPYGGDVEDDDNDGNEEDSKDDEDSGHAKQDILATLPYGLEETQAYDDNNDTDSAQNSMVEATQAYGIEEPSEAELQAQQNERATKKTNKKRVAFASSSTEGPEVDETEVDVPVVGKDDKSKPSSSSTVDADDYLPDSEDLILQPRSRSNRRRKKPVIEESQDETSQQLGEAGNQSESVVASSSAGTTEQMDGISKTPEGKDKTQLTKPTTRKGRRGAMRVTIETEEPQEEEERETSTRKGRKGVMVVTDEPEVQEENVSKGTAGRKRGRQTAKTTSIVEEEEEETPVTKSRRGRRGKAAQVESTSASETPLKTPTGPAAVQDVAVVVEPLNVRRGGRGRGRKGATAKETAQAAQGEEVSAGTSVEPQPQSHIEDVPTRGKGKGKGRGKKNQPSVNESVETESLDAELPAISDDVLPEQALTTPARGKGRGKGRGKKAQPKITTDPELEASTSSSPYLVPETPFINNGDDELPPPESPVVASASKGKSRGRQGRGKKTQPSVTELETAEETSQPESNSGSRESSQTRKGRGRGKVSRESCTVQISDIAITSSESTELSETIGDFEESSTAGSSKGSRRGRQRKEAVEDSETVEVEETPAKKSRRGKEPAVNRSPSLNRGKPSVGSTPKIMFTGLFDKQGEKVVASLGGQLVDNIHICTHLVTDKVRRTVKFLCGLASGQIIVLPSWLDACKKAKSFVDTSPFLVKDKDAEKQYKFNLQRSHEVALTKSLLEGYKIHVTKKVKPEPSQMKDIIQSAKGEFLSSMPRSKDDRVFVISCEEDRSVCKKPLEAGIPVVSAEVLLTGVLRQELNLEEHKLFAEEMSDASQDTSASSGQSKRRRGASEAGASSSTAETKSTGSKRRKR